MKAAVRLYPVDVDLLERTALGTAGATARVLTASPSTEAATRLVSIPLGVACALPPGPGSSELVVLSGSVRLGGRRLGPGSYVCVQPGQAHEPLLALEPTELVEFQEAPGPHVDKPAVVLDTAAVEAIPWTVPVDGGPDGLTHRVLAGGPDEAGSLTRVLRVEPMVATGIFTHDHAEEVLMLEGAYRMAEEYHPAGTYTAKGPGVAHGPFTTSTGYVGLEVRNYV